MVDPFVLTMLSRPKTIDGVEYMVAWDSKRNCATILVIDDEAKLRDYVNEDGEEVTFKCELDAHRYLIGLKVEKDGDIDKSWRDL